MAKTPYNQDATDDGNEKFKFKRFPRKNTRKSTRKGRR